MSSPVQGPKKDIAVIDVDPEPFPSIPRAIILDLSPVNFLDTVGVKALQNVWRSKINKKTNKQRDEQKTGSMIGIGWRRRRRKIRKKIKKKMSKFVRNNMQKVKEKNPAVSKLLGINS